MPRSSNISVLGLYQWDNTLFDLMQIPEELDSSTLVNNLLAELAELEVIYPNPVVMKNLIGVWSTKQLDVWNKLYATTQFEYNPIENYNRIETGSDAGLGRTTHSGTDTTADSSTYGGSDTTTGSGTDGHWIAGFNSTASGDNDGLVKQTRDENDATSTTRYGQTNQRAGNKTYGERIDNTSETSHTLQARGNIGVTTTQEMIEQERKIDLFNVYDIIINDFKNRFCILVY